MGAIIWRDDLRIAGVTLLAVVVLFAVGAFSAAYFRKMPLPQTPLEQLIAIAENRIGWTVQVIIFPVMSAALALADALDYCCPTQYCRPAYCNLVNAMLESCNLTAQYVPKVALSLRG